MKLYPLVVGQMAENCYLVVDNKSHEAIVIDPGDDAEYIIDELGKRNATPKMILATHGHFDHIMSAFAIQAAYGIPFYIHKEDAFLVRQMASSAKHFLGLPHVDPPPEISGELKEKQIIPIGASSLRVVHTPGHTPGSITFVIKDIETLIVGDVLFAGGGVGRTDFSYSNRDVLTKSIDTLMSFPSSFSVRSGHGEASWVGEERQFHRYGTSSV